MQEEEDEEEEQGKEEKERRKTKRNKANQRKRGRAALIRGARTCRGGETIRFVMRGRTVTERAWGVSG